ncbi:chitosanase [Nocardioides cynanchi]|uniref:chitosanase n=1 Tax=Nocardioides cynanchi TaxID=2558918 RepID=UPI001245276A|nr:chitosanase [Nocardioides cynanchi]
MRKTVAWLLVALVAISLAVTLLPAADAAGGLERPHQKEVAQILVSTAENSSRDWRAQYRYIEYDVEHSATENRGYTGGIIGFTSKTHDMLAVVRRYVARKPADPLAPFLPALRRVDGTSSRQGLGRPFVRAWHRAAADPAFRRAQDHFRDAWYFDPAVHLAQRDGLHSLGQFAYYDAAVVHGLDGLRAVRRHARARADIPTDGGRETAYLQAFLTARIAFMRREQAHQDVTRITTAQQVFLDAGNLGLRLPLRWSVYGDSYRLSETALRHYRLTGHF